MDQHFFLTTLNAPLPELTQPDSTSSYQRHYPGLGGLAKGPNASAHDELMTALLQICKTFDQKLTYELLRNRLLLQKLTATLYFKPGFQNSVSKLEEINEEQGKVQSVDAKAARKEVKERKLAVNDTKNISKNFGKAVITFIQKNPERIKRILQNHNIELGAFSQDLKERKKNLISIKELRALWLDSEFEYARAFREISNLFLRKASFKYIFGSRIADFVGHLKYRRRMIQALQQPQHFTSIKQ